MAIDADNLRQITLCAVLIEIYDCCQIIENKYHSLNVAWRQFEFSCVIYCTESEKSVILSR